MHKFKKSRKRVKPKKFFQIKKIMIKNPRKNQVKRKQKNRPRKIKRNQMTNNKTLKENRKSKEARKSKRVQFLQNSWINNSRKPF